MAISKNAIIIDTLAAGRHRATRRRQPLSTVCNVEKDGSFGANAGKLAALKVASLRREQGQARHLARPAVVHQGAGQAKQGFSQVFIVKGGYNGWSRRSRHYRSRSLSLLASK